jgi:hypothetical protein
MATNIFIPSSIRDKGTRDTISNIARAQGITNGSTGSGTRVTVQDSAPGAGDAGVDGDMIYASDVEEIWIFDGTTWVLVGGAAGANSQNIVITRRIYTPSLSDPSSWSLHQDGEFRNDLGTPIALVATGYNGGEQYSLDTHINYFTYAWTRNGLAYNPVEPFPDGSPQSRTRRYLLIGPDDVIDGSDQFEVEIPQI